MTPRTSQCLPQTACVAASSIAAVVPDALAAIPAVSQKHLWDLKLALHKIRGFKEENEVMARLQKSERLSLSS